MPNLFTSIFIIILAMSFASTAATSPKSDTPADYAHAVSLQVSGSQGVVSVQLPQTVYLNAQMSNLDDLRVFDAKGVVQPHALYRPSPQAQIQRTNLTANIFPVHSPKRTNTGTPTLDLAIQTRPDGSVSSVQMHTGNPVGNAVLDSLVLDLGPWQTQGGADDASQIEALRFALPKDRTNYNAEVWLETSNDLKSWKTAGAAELSWLSNDDAQVLANDRLEFSPHRFRYARLSWRRGEPAQFSQVQAERVARQNSEPVRETLWISPFHGKQLGDLVYKASPALPVEQVSLRLSEPNIVYPMMLGTYIERSVRKNSRATETVFQPIARATFYQITQDGEIRRSGALNLSTSHQSEWIVRPFNPGSTAQPELGLSWQPATLIFLSGGMPPYSLHFGRDNARSVSLPLNQVAPGFSPGDLSRLEKARVGDLQTGGSTASSKASLTAEATQAAQIRTIILWGVLFLGVAVLGAMVWRLVRQMNSSATGKKL